MKVEDEVKFAGEGRVFEVALDDLARKARVRELGDLIHEYRRRLDRDVLDLGRSAPPEPFDHAGVEIAGAGADAQDPKQALAAGERPGPPGSARPASRASARARPKSP